MATAAWQTGEALDLWHLLCLTDGLAYLAPISASSLGSCKQPQAASGLGQHPFLPCSHASHLAQPRSKQRWVYSPLPP